MTNQNTTTAKKKPTVHLFIPQLLQPLIVWKKDFAFEPQSEYLSQLFRQFSCTKESDSQCLSEALFRSIGVPQNAEIPMAHYRYQSHKDSQSLSTLICADPVHLVVGMNDVTLTQAIDDLSEDEAHELIDLLNSHFKQDDLAFVVGSTSQWYISSLGSENFFEDDFNSQPVDTVLKQNIADKLPSSLNRNWQAIQNEAQMLLHGSAVNQQREAMGLPAVNSLWLWGAGKPLTEEQQQKDIELVIGGNRDEGIEGQTISKAINCDWQEYSDTTNWSECLTRNTMIIADQLFLHAVNSQPEQFQKVLTQLDTDIIKPLMSLWKQNKIELLIDSCDGYLFKPKKVPAWQFWHKPISLLDVAQNSQKEGRCCFSKHPRC